MKIAVTSASGKLGTEIVKQLIKEIGRENVVGIARTTEKAKHLGVEIRKGDYNNQSDFDTALIDVDAVLLVSGMDDPEKRIQQHKNVIEAAKKNKLKKIVYTSIIGNDEKYAFSPIVKSNRQTEKDVQDSALNYVIGRNSIYIEPDIEYLEHYIKDGEIRNCAANGKCTYTSRKELALAYTKMLIDDKHNGATYNLAGQGITQTQLTSFLNDAYNTSLVFNNVSVEDYKKERINVLGDFIGTIISGIYEGIKYGVNDVTSDFENIVGRPHKSPSEMIEFLKNESNNL